MEGTGARDHLLLCAEGLVSEGFRDPELWPPVPPTPVPGCPGLSGGCPPSGMFLFVPEGMWPLAGRRQPCRVHAVPAPWAPLPPAQCTQPRWTPQPPGPPASFSPGGCGSCLVPPSPVGPRHSTAIGPWPQGHWSPPCWTESPPRKGQAMLPLVPQAQSRPRLGLSQAAAGGRQELEGTGGKNTVPPHTQGPSSCGHSQSLRLLGQSLLWGPGTPAPPGHP